MPIVDYPLTLVGSLREPRPFLPLKIISLHNHNSTYARGVVDPGAGTTLIPYHIADELGLDIENGKQGTGPTAGGELQVYFHPLRIQVLAIDNNGEVDSNDIIMNIPPKDFAVSSNKKFPPTILLGIKDFLEPYVLTIDYPGRVFSIRKPAEPSR